jgi:hypothetical protein
MITEDYVSFEVAKLLKEKGFNVPTWFYYQNKELKLASWSGWDEDWNHCLINDKPSTLISAPTIQMVMKWLRNIHGLFIHIDVIRETSCWLADIQDIKDDVNVYPVKEDFSNYEGACEAAIKYCLENLV